MKYKVGDTVSYHELTGTVISVFDTPSGVVFEIECPAKSNNDLNLLLWLPESELPDLVEVSRRGL